MIQPMDYFHLWHYVAFIHEPIAQEEVVRDVLNICRMGHFVHLIIETPLH